MCKNPFNFKILLTAAFTSWAVFSAAQYPQPYEAITTANGLSQGMVFDILQDQQGFIWVATKNGLNRYDGYTFKVFNNDPYNTRSLSGNTILSLFEDSKGRIWAGTENAGVNIYDKKTGQFYRIVQGNATTAGLSGNSIRDVLELDNGSMLIATEASVIDLIAVNENFFLKGASPVVKPLQLPNNSHFYGMGKDKDGRIWIGTMDGLVYQLNTSNNVFTQLLHGQLLNDGYLNADSSKLINRNLYLQNGKTLIPLFNPKQNPAGNIVFKPKTKLWENLHREEYHYDVFKHQWGGEVDWSKTLPATSTRICYPFLIDRAGVLWCGAVGYGLRKYPIENARLKIYASGKSIRLIIPTPQEGIFLVDFSYQWKKLMLDSLDPVPFDKLPSLAQANNLQVDNLIVGSTKDYWFKSDENGYFRYSPFTRKTVLFPQINADQPFGNKQPFIEDRKARIWFPGLNGKITMLNLSTNTFDSFSIGKASSKIICTALYEDTLANYWVGTEKGFAKITFPSDPSASKKISWFYNDNSNRNSLNYNHISCFLDDPADPEKYLWIATKGGGLNRLDKKTGDFFHLTLKDGLPDNVVYGILADEKGNIWGSTNKGIFCLSGKKNAAGYQFIFRNFTKANGLQDDEFNTGAFAKLADGKLAFGGVNGVNIFDPATILTPDFMPNVFITDLLINNQSVAPYRIEGLLKNTIEQSKLITLTHLQDIVTLEFTSLDFTAPAQNKYRYQLVGVDDDWVESGTRRTATYLHLPPGRYNFKVCGSNSKGIWSNNIAELKIRVLPPWWRTWWAYLLYTVMVAFAIRTYLKFTVNRARLTAQLNFEHLEAKRVKEMDAVKTQLYTNITHEFRTPLTVILGMAQQVISNPEKHFANGMDMIVRNGKSLLNLVNEMLDLSKLNSGKMHLQLVNGDVINFLRYIVESFHSLAESQKKQLHFLSEIDELMIAYDPEKVRQIISNLLSNAIKFTNEKDNIYISVNTLVQKGSERALLVIKVKDTGIGIPQNQVDHVFDRFYQLDNSHTRKTEGTGIGLALTKELIKLMEGVITVKSPPVGANKGSEFTVTLPCIPLTGASKYLTDNELERTMHNDVGSSAENNFGITTDEKNTDKPLILLVEDNADVVAYTASCLPDYRLAVGKDGREGFEIALELIPDLIVTDVMMPFVDGFELCQQLRASEYTSHIPIIMLTAKADIENKMEGLLRGADAYLQKPFNREELLIRIKKLLELRKNLQQFYLNKVRQPVGEVKTLSAVEEVMTGNNIEDAFVKRVRAVIEDHFTDANFSVEILCKKIFMSHSQLHRKLDALTGCSPNKFIRIVRLNSATALLKQTSNSIAYIAMHCGFNDPGYFARIFKQEYGCTPQEWRSGNSVCL